MKKLYTTAVAVLIAGLSYAQITVPAPSPLCKTEQRVGITDVSIAYSRPGVKGRKIFGDLLPFGEIWRFGANSPTKIKFADTLMAGGQTLPPGEYAIYAIPGASEWTILFGKDPKVQAGDFKQADAAAKLTVKPEALATNVESFTLEFSDLTSNSANLTMRWEKTAVKIPLTAEVDRKVMASIKSTLNDVGPYWSAANYYYDNNRDLKTALEWVDKVIEKNPQFYNVHLKAKIQKKMGDCKAALVTAERSLELSKTAKNRDYEKLNEKLIADCKAGK